MVEVTGMTNLAAYRAEQIWPPFSESLLQWEESFHDLMLNDKLRVTAYRKAIHEAVKPGHVVVDLGTGTGILSQFALEAGARCVYGIDLNSSILDHAVQRMHHAGLAERFVPICRLSYDVQLPQSADVLISEIIGNIADNEDFQPILQDAIRRFIKPAGTVLPQAVSSYLVPVAARSAHADLVEGRIAYLGPAYQVADLYREKGITSPFDLYYDCILPRRTYLSQPWLLRTYSGAWDQSATYSVSTTCRIDRQDALTGFKAYFVAELTSATTLDISGDDIEAGETSDSWKHAYLPIAEPIETQADDQLSVTFSRNYPRQGTAFRQIYRWQGSVSRGGKIIGRFDQSTEPKACP
jgi:protein arginine N-methyltransferase 1